MTLIPSHSLKRKSNHLDSASVIGPDSRPLPDNVKKAKQVAASRGLRQPGESQFTVRSATVLLGKRITTRSQQVNLNPTLTSQKKGGGSQAWQPPPNDQFRYSQKRRLGLYFIDECRA